LGQIGIRSEKDRVREGSGQRRVGLERGRVREGSGQTGIRMDRIRVSCGRMGMGSYHIGLYEFDLNETWSYQISAGRNSSCQVTSYPCVVEFLVLVYVYTLQSHVQTDCCHVFVY
jgi:hypothetical protein